MPQDVESASRSEMSSGSWRLSVQEFPELSESRVGDHQHGFFTLSSFLHVPSKSSFIYMYKREREHINNSFSHIIEFNCTWKKKRKIKLFFINIFMY